MLVMERFGGTLWRRGKAAIAFTLSLYLLAGCSPFHIDEMRPEINRSEGLLVYPESFIDQAAQLAGIDGTIGGEGSDSSTPNVPDMNTPGSDKDGVVEGGDATLDEDGLTHAKTDAQMLSATSYAAYLTKYVTEPMEGVIAKIGADAAKDVYFRVVHTGYNPMGIDNSTIMEEATPYSYTSIGSRVPGYGVAGLAVSEFAFDYLYSLPGNKKLADQQRVSALAALNKSGSLSPNTSWASVDRNNLPFRQEYIAMWGNERLNAEAKFSQFISAINKSMVGTIPNLGMMVKTSPSCGRGTRVILNECKPGMSRYADSVTTTALNYIFGTYNNHEDHVVSKVLTGVKEDDRSITWYRSDGWGKTIVMLGTTNQKTLKGLFGDHFQEASSIIRGVKPNTEWATISAMDGMEGSSTISAGARGTS